jgi:hypothetical protein
MPTTSLSIAPFDGVRCEAMWWKWKFARLLMIAALAAIPTGPLPRPRLTLGARKDG